MIINLIKNKIILNKILIKSLEFHDRKRRINYY